MLKASECRKIADEAKNNKIKDIVNRIFSEAEKNIYKNAKDGKHKYSVVVKIPYYINKDELIKATANGAKRFIDNEYSVDITYEEYLSYGKRFLTVVFSY